MFGFIKPHDYTQNSRCRTSVPVNINVQIWLVHLSGHEELPIEHVNPSVVHIENTTLCLETNVTKMYNVEGSV